MIELTKSPEHLLTCHNGEKVLVDGVEFMFESTGEKCFLTKVVGKDAEDWWENDNEDSFPWQHVRDDRGVALMTRKELKSILEYGTFTIY